MPQVSVLGVRALSEGVRASDVFKRRMVGLLSLFSFPFSIPSHPQCQSLQQFTLVETCVGVCLHALLHVASPRPVESYLLCLQGRCKAGSQVCGPLAGASSLGGLHRRGEWFCCPFRFTFVPEVQQLAGAYLGRVLRTAANVPGAVLLCLAWHPLAQNAVILLCSRCWAAHAYIRVYACRESKVPGHGAV